MRSLGPLILISLIPICLSGQDFSKISLDHLGIKGQVKSYTELNYNINEGDDPEEVIKEKPGKYEETHFNKKGYIEFSNHYRNGDLEGKSVYTYNKKGGLTSVAAFGPDGSEMGVMITQVFDKQGNLLERNMPFSGGKETWSYNGEGNKVEYTTYRNGEPRMTHKYDYDDSGYNTREMWVRPDGTIDYEFQYVYDDRGNMLEKNGMFNNELNDRWVFKYDEDGNKIEEGHARGDGVVYARFVYSFDDNRNVISKEEYGKNGELVRKESFTYDMQGNMTEEMEKANQHSRTFKYEFQYDQQGNWTRRYMIDEQGIANIKLREFIYY